MDKHIINILMISDDEDDFTNLHSEFRKNKVINPLSLVFDGKESPDALKKKIAESMNGSIPSVILLDVSLPDLNGLKHLEWLKGEQELKNTRVFIISSSDEVKKQAVATKHNNVAGYIDKPVTFPKFASAISELKSSWQYFEES